MKYIAIITIWVVYLWSISYVSLIVAFWLGAGALFLTATIDAITQ